MISCVRWTATRALADSTPDRGLRSPACARSCATSRSCRRRRRGACIPSGHRRAFRARLVGWLAPPHHRCFFMHHPAVAVQALMLVLAGSCQAVCASELDDLLRAIEARRVEHDIPGVGLALVSPTAVLWSGGLGVT